MDSGVAEMCHLFCVQAGRGHLHTKLCKNDNDISSCTERKNGKIVQRHCVSSTKYHGLDEKTGVDELVHEEYWKKIGFEDPYSENKDKLKSFGKCNAFCGHPSHVRKQKISYCKLHVWHDDIKDDPTSECTIADGHKFECTHPKPPHVYVNKIIPKFQICYVLGIAFCLVWTEYL